MSELVYKEPEPITDREVVAAIKRDDLELVRLIPIRLGFNHENWKFIQDICVQLSGHRDPWVRANSLLGLSYAARFRAWVEKNVVKPVLLRGLRDADSHVSGTAQDAIDDINHLMKWSIGSAKKQKAIESRFEKRKKANQSPQTTPLKRRV